MAQEVAVEISVSPQPSTTTTKLEKCIVIFFFVLTLPFYLLYAAGAWLICNKNVIGDFIEEARRTQPPGRDQWFPILTVYQRALHKLNKAAKKYAKLPNAIRIRLLIIFVPWLVVGYIIPSVRKKTIPFELWRWSLLASMGVYGYKLISWATQLLLYHLRGKWELRKKKGVVYFAKGMRQSVNHLVLWGSLMLAWGLLFRMKEPHVLQHLGTGTSVTMAVGAVLWALRTALSLIWEANTVYRRFWDRIVSAGWQFYCLCLICVWRFEKHAQVSQISTKRKSKARTDQHDRKNEKEIRDSENRRRKAKRILCICKEIATLYDIKKMAKYFVYLSRASSREDDGTSDVLEQCQKINTGFYKMYITEKDLSDTFKLEDEDASILYSMLKDEYSDFSDQISYKDFEKYMVKAHKNCIALGHTLSDAKEVVKVLNQVMTSILAAIVFIAWLLLTNIVTTKFLVLIASPPIAATLAFGNSTKTIFEGIIFSFINHPFDVGDRCIIDNTELEVKHMSVLSTKFIVIETREEAVYPNSTLASTHIINLKGEPEPIGSDRIELTLDSKYSKSMLDALLNKINEHIVTAINEDGCNRYEKAPTIIIKEIRDSVKMEIRYEHVMSIHETMHSQCLRKREQKSELLMQLMQFIEEIEWRYERSD